MFVRGLLSLCLLVSATACGGDGGGAVDASTPVDAPKLSEVMEVVCPATPAVTFTTGANNFLPQVSASITVGQIVKFDSNVGHPIGAIENEPLSHRDLVVPDTQTKCFKFLTAGMVKFQCTQHQYKGTITVN